MVLNANVWMSKATQAFATTTAYFKNKNWSLTSCVHKTKHFPGHHTGISISEKLQEILTTYETDKQCVGYCS